jgi:SpoVK/Ycf46/Vps4 family AAA+-type ATPase
MAPAQPSSYLMDPHQIMTVTMTNMISEQILSILRSSEGLDASKVFKLFAMMSMNEIRKVFMSMISKFGIFIETHSGSIFMWLNYICKNFKYVFRFVYYCCNFLRPKKQPNILLEDNIVVKESQLEVLTINIDPTLPFMQTFTNYISTNPNITFQINDERNICMENIEKNSITETWHNININYNQIDISIDSSLLLTFEEKKGKRVLTEYNNINNNIDITNAKYLSDLIPNNKLKKLIQQFVIQEFDGAYSKTPFTIKSGSKVILTTSINIFKKHNVSMNYISCNNGTLNGNYYEVDFIEYLQSKIPNLDAETSLYELLIIEYIYGKLLNLTYFRKIYNEPVKFYIFGTLLDITDADKTKFFGSNTNSNILLNAINAKNDKTLQMNDTDKKYIVSIFQYCYNSMKKLLEYKNAIGDISASGKSIKFIVSSDKINKSQLYKEFGNFIQYINSYIEEKSSKEPVTSYVIMIEHTEKIINVSNPEYIAYVKQKNNAESLLNISGDTLSGNTGSKKSKNKIKSSIDEQMSQSLLYGYASKYIPSETIEKITVEKKVIVKEINELYKNFNTLYLRKHDLEKLKNMLELFHENKSLWEEMGIPNKLGILLHGLPGTGKSSTIAAIASYMKKDIYCVDFKTIQTNNDFMLIVEYVNKHCINGGILTFEDIDAMSEILHKRFNKSSDASKDIIPTEQTTMDLYNSSNKELTLDYILNVFQGSLTPSGFIFIATTNHLDELDQALYRDGRFDIKIDMKLCDHYQIQSIYTKIMKRCIPQSLLNNIQEDKFTPATILFRIIHYARGDHADEIILEPFLT